MNDDELLDYSREHISYELLMLYATAARLVNDPKVHDDWVVKNALLEAFTIHARVIAAFRAGVRGLPRPAPCDRRCHDV